MQQSRAETVYKNVQGTADEHVQACARTCRGGWWGCRDRWGRGDAALGPVGFLCGKSIKFQSPRSFMGQI